MLGKDCHVMLKARWAYIRLATLQILHQIEADWTTNGIEELLSLHQTPPQPASLLNHTPSDPQVDNPADWSKKEPNNQSKSRKKFQHVQALLNVRQEFFESQFEGQITCSEYEPESIVSNLLDRLMALSTIVIYSCHLRPLSDLQTLLKSKTEFIQITISQPWLRVYQVLVGRTHPEMNGTHHGGFIFSAIKVISSC
ncbi:hypothetical protein PTTG_09724, partial [Puccinia triticina 1-1 BBBD Race 1]